MLDALNSIDLAQVLAYVVNAAFLIVTAALFLKGPDLAKRILNKV